MFYCVTRIKMSSKALYGPVLNAEGLGFVRIRITL